jgi:hypothetical protein
MIKTEGGLGRDTIEGETCLMKKIMTMMLGLSLLTGAATVAFAQTDTGTEGKKKKGKKKGTDTEAPKSNKR